jgi:hypothetical protein
MAVVQVVHLHSGTLHTLEGDEEFCLHGDGWFSSGEEMVSVTPQVLPWLKPTLALEAVITRGKGLGQHIRTLELMC